MIRRGRIRVLSILLPALMLGIGLAAASGCSLDYEDTQLDEEFATDLPEAELDDAVITAVRDDGEVRLFAMQVQYFPKRQEQHLTDVRFEELSSDGSVVTEGTAGRARIFSDTDDVELWDDVRLYSYEQEAWIIADFLRYDHEIRVISGRPESRVHIERDDGSTISGIGFSAELELRGVSFSGEVRGTLTATSEGMDADEADN